MCAKILFEMDHITLQQISKLVHGINFVSSKIFFLQGETDFIKSKVDKFNTLSQKVIDPFLSDSSRHLTLIERIESDIRTYGDFPDFDGFDVFQCFSLFDLERKAQDLLFLLRTQYSHLKKMREINPL